MLESGAFGAREEHVKKSLRGVRYIVMSLNCSFNISSLFRTAGRLRAENDLILVGMHIGEVLESLCNMT